MGLAVRTGSDSPRCALLQVPEFDSVVRRGTGADDLWSSVVLARQGRPWRAWDTRAVRRGLGRERGRGAPGSLVGELHA